MDDDQAYLTNETIDASFSQLENCLVELVELAPVTHPKQLRGLLPDATPTTLKLILVELIKVDMASAREAGEERVIDFYLDEFVDLLPNSEIPFDLVLEELQLRKADGEQPQLDEYRARFPDLAVTLGRFLLNTDDQRFRGSSHAVPALTLGTQVDDFQIMKELGEGAFARVYLARQVSMHRLVALKATQRGSDEPQSLSQLDHRNVVRVYDQRQCIDPPVILLYMQYVAGGTLADVIKKLKMESRRDWNGQLLLDSIDECLTNAGQTVPESSSVRARVASMDWASVVAWLGVQLADGLHYAATKNVLHRDVKPANILLSLEAIPKLADFNVSCSGIAGRAGAAAYFGGSLGYMSPEQLQVADPVDERTAESLDGQTDLYSLGLVLWELWQGSRPWGNPSDVASWADAVATQRSLRDLPIETRYTPTSSTERVLETSLKAILAVDATQRPKNGSEAAARLRLVLHPKVADRIEPAQNSWARRIYHWPIFGLMAFLAFAPNVVAATFNFFYNDAWMAEQHSDLHTHFNTLSIVINGIAFPVGAALFVVLAKPIDAAIRAQRAGQPTTVQDLENLTNVSGRMSLVAGLLWVISGVGFAITMSLMKVDFPFADALHFFMSLMLCGGVAWIYPFFGLALLCTLVYYPRLISRTLEDPEFERRRQTFRQQCHWYLLSAATFPLLAMALLLLRQDLQKIYMLTAIVVTALGLLASYFAYQKIDRTFDEFEPVLAPKAKVPMA
jgi:serine/threonine protein kinase